MSVINRMLRDLDQRSQAANAAASVPNGVVRPVSGKGRQQVSAPVALGVIALALAIGGGAWYLHRTTGMLGFLFPASAPVPQFKVKMDPLPPPPPVVAPSPTPVAAASAPGAALVAAAASAVAATRTAAAATEAAVQAGLPAIPASRPVSAKAVAEKPAEKTADKPGDKPTDKPADKAAERAIERAATARTTPAAAPAPTDPAPAARATEQALRSAGGKTYSPSQLQANLMAEAVRLDQQGRVAEAKLPLQKILQGDPQAADARQLLVQLQVETGRLDEARSLLIEGRQLQPSHSGFALALGRLQLDAGDAAAAARTLTDAVPAAAREPQYLAVLAAAQLRLQQYENSAQNYLSALRSDPANPHWLVGVAVAWEATGKRADALEAYRRADTAENLPPELSRFIADRMARLSR